MKFWNRCCGDAATSAAGQRQCIKSDRKESVAIMARRGVAARGLVNGWLDAVETGCSEQSERNRYEALSTTRLSCGGDPVTSTG